MNAKIKLLAEIDKKPFELNFYKFGELPPKTKKLAAAYRGEGREKLPPVPRDNIGYTIFEKIKQRSIFGSGRKKNSENLHILRSGPKYPKEAVQGKNFDLISTTFGEKLNDSSQVSLSPEISCNINNGKGDQYTAYNSFRGSKSIFKTTLDFFGYQDFPALKQLKSVSKMEQNRIE